MNIQELPKTQIEAIRYFADADNCHNFLVSMRWPEGVRCAHCHSDKIGKLSVSGTRRLWNCKACKKQFTAKVGTIFQDSPLGLDKWLPAVWLIVNAKNGVSSCELARSLGITQKSAWHMGHRIRTAMKSGIFSLCGEVEADETFVGGKARFIHMNRRKTVIRAGTTGKIPVGGLLQRSSDGKLSQVKVRVLDGRKQRHILPNVLNNVTPGSKVYTDSLLSYQHLGRGFDHEVIDHAITYVRGRVHTNGLENFWSLLKRTLRGTYVSVDAAHLFRYLDEQATRFNERGENDAERFSATMGRVQGNGVTYAELTGKEQAD